MLRRAGLFAKAVKLCDSVKTDHHLILKLLAFQKQKCAEQDTACYTVAEAEQSAQ